MKKASRKALVSIVIPVYNVEKYLPKCLDSVISQTITDIEIVVIDDGSTDKSPEICDRYARNDNRIRVIHKKNGGLSDARNTGLEICTSDYVTFIDSDDYVSEDYIEVLYESIKRHESDIAISAHFVVYPSRIIDTSTNENYIATPKEILDKLLYSDGIDISAWAKLYKKSLFSNIRFPKGRNYEDAATTYRLIDKSKRISVNSKPTYYYVIRNNSISQGEFTRKKLDLLKSTREMTNYISAKYPELNKACRRRMGYAYLSTLTQAINGGNRKYEKILYEKYIKYRKGCLTDKRIPRRDKIAAIASYFGLASFRISWRLYEKATKRR